MSELCTLAASVLLQSQAAASVTTDCPTTASSVHATSSLLPTLAIAPPPPTPLPDQNPEWSPPQAGAIASVPDGSHTLTAPAVSAIPTASPEPYRMARSLASLESSLHNRERPRSTAQLYLQRWLALQSGQTYTRLPINSFAAKWRSPTHTPTYADWQHLLAREAWSMAQGQGQNRLTIMVGDSLSLWMPTEFLPRYRFWLNQSISGETAAAMAKRLHLFAATRPDTIHLMAGINDLKNGASDREVLLSLQTLMRTLRQQHPTAKVVVHSILPTRLPQLPSDRIHTLNQFIASIAEQEGTHFLDLQPYFTDAQNQLRQELTTDGLHLNYQGYALWRAITQQMG